MKKPKPITYQKGDFIVLMRPETEEERERHPAWIPEMDVTAGTHYLTSKVSMSILNNMEQANSLGEQIGTTTYAIGPFWYRDSWVRRASPSEKLEYMLDEARGGENDDEELI